MMSIEDLCAAVQSSLPLLVGARTGKTINHSYVEAFQDRIKDILNASGNGYTWATEKTIKGRSERDSIDILGTPSKPITGPKWIIEIDATRSDQVSQKFLSRVALWGLKEPIQYVAILYPDTQNGKKSCEKYLRYCNEVLRTINSASSVVGLFVIPSADPKTRTIEVLQFKVSDHFKVNGKECRSMSAACAEAIRVYMGKRPVTYAKLKAYWGRYVEDAERSKAKSLHIQTTDGVTVYHYTQFRQYGLCSFWADFGRLCKQKGIEIIKLRMLYTGSPLYTYKEE